MTRTMSALLLKWEVEGRAARVGLGHDVVDRGGGVALALEGRQRALDEPATREPLLVVAERQALPVLAGVLWHRCPTIQEYAIL
jgi:hypothetical protein